MLKNIFNKKRKETSNNKNILIIALLVHAAKVDENYSDNEKEIIRSSKKGILVSRLVDIAALSNLTRMSSGK